MTVVQKLASGKHRPDPQAQRIGKPALRVYNYSVLDRLGRPMEYRINDQLRSRSAEFLYVSNPEDFAEEQPRERVDTLPHQVLDRERYLVFQIQTAFGVLPADFQLTDYLGLRGAIFGAPLGGALMGWLVAQNRGNLSKQESKPHQTRIYRTWAEMLVETLENHPVDYVRYDARSHWMVDSYRGLLRRVDNRDFVTIEMPGTGGRGGRPKNSCRDLYFTRKDKVEPLYEKLLDLGR